MDQNKLNNNHQKEERYENLNEFYFSLEQGTEIVIEHQGKEYGIFLIKGQIYVAESYHEETQKIYQTIEDALEYKINNEKLRDIITKANIIYRNI